MTISTGDWASYVKRLKAINEQAARKMADWMYAVDWGQRSVEEMIQYALIISDTYGEAAAALACEMYDAVAAASGVVVPPAVPAETASPGTVAKTVTKAAQEAPSIVPSVVGRMVKQAAADTTLQNAQRDGAEFAWVPNGDTCAFCIMLASNGWQRQSKKAARAHATHIHSNCDCEYAVRFDGKGGPAGYDPDKYLEQYESAEGKTWRGKVNSVRRQQYAANPEKYRAQKRAAYERAKETTALEKEKNDGIINLPDIAIGKSLSAARKSYQIMDLQTGKMFDLVDGTWLKKVQVFAGKGTSTEYRDAYIYADRFGGEPEEWQHVKAFGEIDYYGESRAALIHWSQHDEYGDHDYFVKKWLE